MRTLAAFLAFALVGCSVEGTYVLDQAASQKATDPELVNPNTPPWEWTTVLTIGSDGTAIMKSTGATPGKRTETFEQRWTWKLVHHAIELDDPEGAGMTCTKSGNRLTCSRTIHGSKRAMVDTIIFTES